MTAHARHQPVAVKAVTSGGITRLAFGAWLVLAMAVPVTLHAQAAPQPVPPPPPPVLTEPRTGAFEAALAEVSPLAAARVVLPRLISPAQQEQVLRDIYVQGRVERFPNYSFEPRDESWSIYVPDDYDPNVAYGLVVFMNSWDSGRPQNHWHRVLDRRRMIFVGINNGGDKHNIIYRRIPLALHAVHNLSKIYNVDPERVYLMGFSGGGRAASHLAMAYPEVFRGAFFVYGVNILGQSNEKFPLLLPPGPLLNKAQRENRYVFVTGDRNFHGGRWHPDAVDTAREAFQRARFANLQKFHTGGFERPHPSAGLFQNALNYLDTPIGALGLRDFEQGMRFKNMNQSGRAIEALGRAIGRSLGQEYEPEAKAAVKELREQYDALFEEAKSAIAQGDTRKGFELMTRMRNIWGTFAKNDVQVLANAIRDAQAVAGAARLTPATPTPEPAEAEMNVDAEDEAPAEGDVEVQTPDPDLQAATP